MNLIATDNVCGTCTLCCKVIEVPEYDSPENEYCIHCEENVGCTNHEQRHDVCINFDCVYITDNYDLSLRPDKTGVIFDKLYTRIYQAMISRDRLDDWKTPVVMEHIEKLNKEGISVVVSSYSTGITDIICAEEHEPHKNKILQIAVGFYDKWQRHRTQQTYNHSEPT